MYQSEGIKSVAAFLWKIPICAFTFASGLIASRIFFHFLGMAPPRMPQQADESLAVYYLFSGSLILTAGLFPIPTKISAAFFTRFSILFLFTFICFGVSDSLESSIYSSTGGFDRMSLILLLPTLLFSLVSTALTRSQSNTETFSVRARAFFEKRILTQLSWRAFLAVLSFPVIYFAFGIAVSPFVTDYYQESDFGLAIPEVGTILAVQFVRSILFLLVTLPIVISWTGKRMQLIWSLGFAHFVIVFSYDIVLAYQLPMFLVLVHGVEIFLDSLIYSWAMITLLIPKDLKQGLVADRVG